MTYKRFTTDAEAAEGGVNRRTRLGVFLLVALTVALGCGPRYAPPPFDREFIEQERALQFDAAFGGALERHRRAFAVAEPIRIAAAPLCHPVVGSIGAWLASIDDFERQHRQAVRALLNLNEFVRVTQVVPGFGAHLAGIKEGDFVRRVNGVSPRSGAHAQGLLQLAGPNEIAVYRGGVSQLLTVESTPKCNYPVYLPVDRDVNAFSDGHEVSINSGLMYLLDDDYELAIVVAHEVAHNVLRHSSKKEVNAQIAALVGALLGLAVDIAAEEARVDTHGLGTKLGALFGYHAGSRTYSKEFEREADYVGLYLVELAGFDVGAGVSCFRKLAAYDPTGVITSWGSTHPGWGERAAAASVVAAEIRRRMLSGDLPSPVRTRLAGAAPPEGIAPGLPDTVRDVAERRGTFLGQAAVCRVSTQQINEFKSASRALLKASTQDQQEFEGALAVYERSIAHGASMQSPSTTECHPVVVEFFHQFADD